MRTIEIDQLVADHIARGSSVIEVHFDTYAQHLLREHPNVCRQALAGQGRYAVHPVPCDCPPKPHTAPTVNRSTVCCGLAQRGECFICGSTLP